MWRSLPPCGSTGTTCFTQTDYMTSRREAHHAKFRYMLAPQQFCAIFFCHFNATFRDSTQVIPDGFTRTCNAMGWDSNAMWERLSDDRTWYLAPNEVKTLMSYARGSLISVALNPLPSQPIQHSRTSTGTRATGNGGLMLRTEAGFT